VGLNVVAEIKLLSLSGIDPDHPAFHLVIVLIKKNKSKRQRMQMDKEKTEELVEIEENEI
jgi:hypothetical protein